jgi:hypothetical protein
MIKMKEHIKLADVKAKRYTENLIENRRLTKEISEK